MRNLFRKGKGMDTTPTVPKMGQLETFLNQLEQNSRERQAEDIRQILDCVKAMRTEVAEALEEAVYLREYIQSLETPPLKARLGSMQEEVRESLYETGNQLKEVERQIAEEIKNSMDMLKNKGIQALDQVLDAAHVFQGLSRIETMMTQAVAGMEKKIETVDRMAGELHAIKGHVKNIGRAASGRPAEEIIARDVTKGVLAKFRAGMEYCRKILAGMGQKALIARAHAVHLHQLADPQIEQVSSVQKIAGELRAAFAMEYSRLPEPAQAR